MLNGALFRCRRCCCASMKDILISGDTLEVLVDRTRLVMEQLRTAGFYTKLGKCDFGVTAIVYLGRLASDQGFAADPAKPRAIMTSCAPHRDRRLWISGPCKIQYIPGYAGEAILDPGRYSALLHPLLCLPPSLKPAFVKMLTPTPPSPWAT